MTEQNETEEAYPKPADRFHVVSTCSICREEVSIVLGVSLPRTLSCKKCGLVLAAAKPVGGYVYVLSNKCMPDLVKIGFSTREVESRMAELNASTSIPGPFTLEACFPVEQPIKQEAAVHEKLANYRYSENREFFRLQVNEAVAMVQKALLVEGAIEPTRNTDGVIKIFSAETGRGVIVEISPVSEFSSLSEVFTTPEGYKFRLAAAFMVSNRGSCAAVLKSALAYRRDGFSIWSVQLNEALSRVAKIASEHQRPPASALNVKNERSVVSKAPTAPIFWSPSQNMDQKPSNGGQSQGGFGSSRYD